MRVGQFAGSADAEVRIIGNRRRLSQLKALLTRLEQALPTWGSIRNVYPTVTPSAP